MCRSCAPGGALARRVSAVRAIPEHPVPWHPDEMPSDSLWGPHPSHVGGLLTEQPVLLRGDSVVAYVTNIRGFPAGFLFSVVVEQAAQDREGEGDEPEVIVEFSDGTTWRENLDLVGNSLFRRSSQSSGGSGGASWSAEYWLRALPTAGPVTFRITVYGLSGAGHVDAALIRLAAEQAIDLWTI